MAKLDGLRIAWVEDDADALYAVARALHKEGASVEHFRTYAEAMNSLDRIGQSDVILLDLILALGNGVEEPARSHNEELGMVVLRELRTRKIETPVIIFSVLGDSPSIPWQQLRNSGARSFAKVGYLQDLISEIQETVGKSRATLPA